MLEDPKEYLNRQIDEAARSYVEGLKTRGMQDNPMLRNAYIQRAMKTSETAYIEHAQKVSAEHTAAILAEFKRRDREIRRESAKMSLLICLPSALIFALFAWYSLGQHDYIVSVIFALSSLVFLGMLIVACVRGR